MLRSEKELGRIAWQLRERTVEMVHNARTGHAAPCMSIAEIMSVLYFDELRLRPEQPRWPGRDRFVLSKGHAAAIYYAALAKRGFFPESRLMEYRALGSALQGHPDMRKCPGVDMTSGSLGNGVSAALGMALIAKKDALDHRVYCLCGDGELQEGIVWEAAMYAGNAGLGNLTLLVDNNGLQSGGSVDRIQSLGDIGEKFSSFGWSVQRVDGHDTAELRGALAAARDCPDRPGVIICHTLKGKGVSFMEGEYLWHMKAPNDAEFAQAMEELKREEARYV